MFPEESFKVAMKLKLRDVLLASFKILVNERAVDHAANSPLTRPPKLTWMGRQRTDYGDLPEDPIEHAGRAFADRMKRKLDLLRDDNALDKMAIGEWVKLQYYSKLVSDAEDPSLTHSSGHVDLLAKCHKLKDALRNILRLNIQDCLTIPPEGRLEDLIKAQRAHYCPHEKQTPIQLLLARLNDYQQACLPFFWYNLNVSDRRGFRFRLLQDANLTRLATSFNDALEDVLDRKQLVLDQSDFQSHFPMATPLPFDFELFYLQLESSLSVMSVYATDGSPDLEPEGIAYLMSDHLLLSLKDSELKYLPLWAGGCDDGSGGAFQDEVPPTDMGPSEPGPHYHTGHTVASSAGADTDADAAPSTAYAPTSGTFSDLGMDGLDLEDGTTARSTVAQDGVSADCGRGRVESVASEAFTSGDERSMVEAMYAVPADHQAHGRALADYVEGVGDDGGQDTETEEGYDDDAMDTDSTLSLGDCFDDEDDSEFEMV